MEKNIAIVRQIRKGVNILNFVSMKKIEMKPELQAACIDKIYNLIRELGVVEEVGFTFNGVDYKKYGYAKLFMLRGSKGVFAIIDKISPYSFKEVCEIKAEIIRQFNIN